MHASYLKPLTAAALAAALFARQANAEPKPGESPAPAETAIEESSPADLNALAESLEKSFADQSQTEAVRMLIAIARGSQMGPGEGWFGPGQSRYTWDWLVRAQGLEGAKEIAKRQFRGSEEWFERLDRNRNGRIVAADLDWSDDDPYVRQFSLANRMFRRIDKQGDGRLMRDEWLALFDKAARGREHVTTVDLAELLLAGQGGGFAPDDEPAPATLVRGLFRGEIGSLNEGPNLNAPAPDFQLKTHDGKRTIRLSELRGSKPVVLVFGNFTCGPFRAMYPLVEDLKERYQDEAEFLAVYVREAHPSDGWRMGSNARLGVELAQPTTYDERVTAAQQCHAALNYSMPLVVDEINDPVGNSYSGMPARLYVIDREGKVAYKSGRGPFGFKTGEMEQALLMTLLDQPSETAAENP
jgi:thiol-disulfide isomerase/thioredoxin